jgi:hypothetical protein
MNLSQITSKSVKNEGDKMVIDWSSALNKNNIIKDKERVDARIWEKLFQN